MKKSPALSYSTRGKYCYKKCKQTIYYMFWHGWIVSWHRSRPLALYESVYRKLFLSKDLRHSVPNVAFCQMRCTNALHESSSQGDRFQNVLNGVESKHHIHISDDQINRTDPALVLG